MKTKSIKTNSTKRKPPLPIRLRGFDPCGVAVNYTVTNEPRVRRWARRHPILSLILATVVLDVFFFGAPWVIAWALVNSPLLQP